MNKKMIALALAGAAFAPAAVAQSAVTLYGAVRLDLENVEAKGGTSPVPKRTRLTDHPSLLGVRGSEDLGGGIKAFFQLETSFAADQATGGFADRNSCVGLQGGWGSVLMGRWDMPFKTAMGTVDPFGDINKGDWTSANADQGNFSRRAANVVQYWSPSWSGFTMRLAHVVDEGRTATARPTNTGVSLVYSKGPIYVAYAYEEHRDQVGTTITAGAREEGNGIAARLTLGSVKLSGHYGEYKKTALPKEKSYLLGVDWGLGDHHILGSYQNAKVATADCDAFSAGWQYYFSKRTNVLLSYVKIENSSGPGGSMNCNFGAGGGLGVAGQNPQGYGIGMRHYF